MGSTLHISDDILGMPQGWMPQTGTFRLTLEFLANEVESQDKDLVAFLREPVESGYYLSLADLDETQIKIIYDAVDSLIKKIILHRADYPNTGGFVELWNELKAMLLMDTRMGKQQFERKQIKVNESAVWQGPDWIYRVVLEHIIEWLQSKNEGDLAAYVIDQWKDDTDCCDFGKLSATEFHALYRPVELMHRWYENSGEGHGLVSVSRAFLPPLTKCVIEIHKMFKEDARMNENP